MPGRLLNVPLHRMQQEADCLAACAAMELDYIGHRLAYSDLLRLLGVGEFGAPASRIARLASRGVSVEYGEGTWEMIETFVDDDQPVIVLVRTGELPYWQGVDTFHSVVIVGYDQTRVFVNDPYFEDAPKTVMRGDFLLAWLEMGYRYAVISIRSTEPANR